MTEGTQMSNEQEYEKDPRELTAATDAALGLLIDTEGNDREILSAPPSVLRQMILTEARGIGLSETDATIMADGAIEPSRAPDLAEAVLIEMRRNETLRAELDAATARRNELMIIDPVTLGAAALLLAVLKVRRLRLSKAEGLDVSFDPIKSDVVNAVLAFLK